MARGPDPGLLFVYGTLLDDACVRRVVGRSLPRHAARLTGHRRIAPPGSWPRLVPDPAGVVDGAVLDVDAVALAALDVYEDEGRLYRREVIVVRVDDAPVRSWVYRALFAPSGTPDPASDA